MVQFEGICSSSVFTFFNITLFTKMHVNEIFKQDEEIPQSNHVITMTSGGHECKMWLYLCLPQKNTHTHKIVDPIIFTPSALVRWEGAGQYGCYDTHTGSQKSLSLVVCLLPRRLGQIRHPQLVCLSPWWCSTGRGAPLHFIYFILIVLFHGACIYLTN